MTIPLTPRNGPERLPWWIAGVILLMASGWFVVRGPSAAIRDGSDDFALIYISARAWAHGVNPYDGASLDELWAAADGDPALAPSSRGVHDLLYPPASLPLLAPIAAFPWPTASVLWMLLNTAAFIAAALSLVRWAGGSWSPRNGLTLAILAGALVFGPVHTGIRMGQTTLIVLACVCGAHALRSRGWIGCLRAGIREDSGAARIGPGVLLGVAAVVKPQFGVPLLIYELFRRRWTSAAIGIGVAGFIAAIGIGRLAIADVDWLPSLRENVELFTTTGAGDASRDNPIRYQMINLEVLWRLASDADGLVRVLVLATVGALSLIGLPIWWRAREDRRELLGLSLALALCLLIVYHRYYDAAVLLVPATWAIGAIHRRKTDRIAWLLLIAIAPLLVPGAAALQVAAQRGLVPESVTGTVVWRDVIMLHQAWLMPVITVIVLAALWRSGQSPEDAGHAESAP